MAIPLLPLMPLAFPGYYGNASQAYAATVPTSGSYLLITDLFFPSGILYLIFGTARPQSQ